jgi:hypothetical protein
VSIDDLSSRDAMIQKARCVFGAFIPDEVSRDFLILSRFVLMFSMTRGYLNNEWGEGGKSYD